MKLALLLFLLAPPRPDTFVPTERLPGVGLGRRNLTPQTLAACTERMVESQTFAIMREAQAAAGASRVTGGGKLRALFRSAARTSGVPAATLEAIAYLESWGNPRAQSPSGARGIMQIMEDTAKEMGLKVERATRYKVTREQVVVGRRGKKPAYDTVKTRKPYSVIVRDERLLPERAIPAAARYLAGLEQRLGGRDWAIFAYHCGAGCAKEMLDLTRAATPSGNGATVARMFFSASPADHRPLYQAVLRNLDRDFSPTYWFRVRRAEQLLALYRKDPAAFGKLAESYRSQFTGGARAPHRLSVWLKRGDLVYRHADDLRAAQGSRLFPAPDRPAFFGFSLANGGQASPAALGTLLYIAFETRRLHAALRPEGEVFQPLEVTALAEPGEGSLHASGEVVAIRIAQLPEGQRECLWFVLNDLGWQGYLGFSEEDDGTIHLGCSPGARAVFARVFQQAVAAGASYQRMTSPPTSVR
jgi:hypothetical protein